MTPSGIEPATFRFAVQRLNHCATAIPSRSSSSRSSKGGSSSSNNSSSSSSGSSGGGSSSSSSSSSSKWKQAAGKMKWQDFGTF